MSLCKAQGRPDMYGLGIRVSYIQWFAALVFQHIGEESLPEIRLLGLLLAAGITIGMLVQLANGELDAAAVHILLLLATGSHMFLAPVYAWRALTCCNPYWNRLEWCQEEQLRTFRVLNFALLLTASSVGVWFYTTHLPGLHRGCHQYGFFFSKAPLDNNPSFAALHAILHLLVVTACVAIVVSKACGEDAGSSRRRVRRRRIRHVSRGLVVEEQTLFADRGASNEHVDSLRRPLTLSNLTVFAVLVAAIELPVQWNELPDANRVDTSAQLIALLVSIGIVSRVTYLHFVEDDDEPASSPGVIWHDAAGISDAAGMPRPLPAVYTA